VNAIVLPATHHWGHYFFNRPTGYHPSRYIRCKSNG